MAPPSVHWHLADVDICKSELREPAAHIVVVGFAAVDITSQSTTSKKFSATTYPGRNHLSLGGVARNMAECAHRLFPSYGPSPRGPSPSAVRLVSPVCQDALGDYLLRETEKLGMRIDGFFLTSPSIAADKDGNRTASVSLQLDGAGDLISGVADIDPSSFSTSDVARQLSPLIKVPSILAFDANLSADTMAEIIKLSLSTTTALYEPTSVPKCTALIDAVALLQRQGRLPPMETSDDNDRRRRWGVDVMTPNELEVVRMASRTSELGLHRIVREDESVRKEAHGVQTEASVYAAAMSLCNASGSVLLVKGGARGVLVVLPPSTEQEARPRMFRVPAQKVRQEIIVSTTGAGDTFAGSILVDLALRQRPLSQESPSAEEQWWRQAVERGQEAAAITLASPLPVSPLLDTSELFSLSRQK